MATEYLTPDDVATQLKVSRQVVYNWINDGRLRAVKAGRTLRIPPYALEAFLQPVHVGDISAGDVEPEPRYLKERFTAAAQAAIEASFNEIQRRQHAQGEVEHLLWALLQPADGVARQVLRLLGVELQQVVEPLEAALAKLPSDPTLPLVRPMVAMGPSLMHLPERAEALASVLPDLQIDAQHVFQAVYEVEDSPSGQILRAAGVTPERLQRALLEVRSAQIAAPPPAPRPSEGVEQRLARIEAELAALRAMLAQLSSGKG